jgi:hypothetical protein
MSVRNNVLSTFDGAWKARVSEAFPVWNKAYLGQNLCLSCRTWISLYGSTMTPNLGRQISRLCAYDPQVKGLTNKSGKTSMIVAQILDPEHRLFDPRVAKVAGPINRMQRGNNQPEFHL